MTHMQYLMERLAVWFNTEGGEGWEYENYADDEPLRTLEHEHTHLITHFRDNHEPRPGNNRRLMKSGY